jgi:hypothetical protein
VRRVEALRRVLETIYRTPLIFVDEPREVVSVRGRGPSRIWFLPGRDRNSSTVAGFTTRWSGRCESRPVWYVLVTGEPGACGSVLTSGHTWPLELPRGPRAERDDCGERGAKAWSPPYGSGQTVAQAPTRAASQ